MCTNNWRSPNFNIHRHLISTFHAPFTRVRLRSLGGLFPPLGADFPTLCRCCCCGFSSRDELNVVFASETRLILTTGLQPLPPAARAHQSIRLTTNPTQQRASTFFAASRRRRLGVCLCIQPNEMHILCTRKTKGGGWQRLVSGKYRDKNTQRIEILSSWSVGVCKSTFCVIFSRLK